LIGRTCLNPQIFEHSFRLLAEIINRPSEVQKRRKAEKESMQKHGLPSPSQVKMDLSHFGWQLENLPQDLAVLSWS
jgi:hypothetical protein